MQRYRLHDRLKFVVTIRSTPQNVEDQIDFARRRFLGGDGHKKSANMGMLAHGNGGGSVTEYAELAARHQGSDVTTTKSERGISLEQRSVGQARPVTGRKNRV